MVLTSKVLRQRTSVISRAWKQPTMPAKQKRWSRLPSVLTTASTPSATLAESVTSTDTPKTLASGKSFASSSSSACALRRVASRSQRQHPEAPCSSKARAVDWPSVPAPPVTIAWLRTDSSESFGRKVKEVVPYGHILTTLPSTANLAIALPSELR